MKDFIEKAKEIHGEKYDYSLVEYKSNFEKIKIVCKEHGIFEQLPHSHIKRKQGCKLCSYKSIKNKLSMNTQDFIKKAKEIHGDRYDYSESDYISAFEKVKIICSTHGVFEQRASDHLSNHGCVKCFYNENLLTQEEFLNRVKKIHKNKYNYDLVKYKNVRTKVKIICSTHGVFEQKANCHLRGVGCKKCAIDNSRSSVEEFINKAKLTHNDRYNYLLVDYKNNYTKVKIVCSTHGVFEQTPYHHLYGSGCPQCPTIISKPHQKIINYLIEKGFKENEDFIVNDRNIIKPMELDIWAFKQRIAIEIDGVYWHGKLEKCREDKNYIIDRDQRKNEKCEKKGIKLLRFTDIEINESFEKIKEDLSFLF